MDLTLLDKYRRAFGIKTSIEEFSPIELKRRWRILCLKYHPDKPLGTNAKFRFIQDAYTYLKKYCKGKEKEETGSFETEIDLGIREIKVKDSNTGRYAYLWDIGEPNFKKRFEFNERNKRKNYYGYF